MRIRGEKTKDENKYEGEKGKIIRKRNTLTFYGPKGYEIGVFEGDLQSCIDLMMAAIKDKIAEAIKNREKNDRSIKKRKNRSNIGDRVTHPESVQSAMD